MCPTFIPRLHDPEYDPDVDRDYSYIRDECADEKKPWTDRDIEFAKGLPDVYLPCEVSNESDPKLNCNSILSQATGLNLTDACCQSYQLTAASNIDPPKCKTSGKIFEEVKSIYEGINNLGWNEGDSTNFCFHPTFMKQHPKYYDPVKNKMIFRENLEQKHIDLP